MKTVLFSLALIFSSSSFTTIAMADETHAVKTQTKKQLKDGSGSGNKEMKQQRKGKQ